MRSRAPSSPAWKNYPNNFHRAGPRGNRLKGPNWPSTKTGSTHDGAVGFLDPFVDDRSSFFDVSPDGSLVCVKHPATFIVNLLQMTLSGMSGPIRDWPCQAPLESQT